MQHKLTLATWTTAILNAPWEMLKVLLIITFGEIGRWLYGGGNFRGRLGDLIICLLIFFLIKPHISSLPTISGVKISPGAVAICIVLIGAHGIHQIFIFFVKKKLGIDMNGIGREDNK